MVDRPADVLLMDKAQPVKMTGFGRLDMTLRKIPGLGVFLAVALSQHWYRSGDWLWLGAFLLFLTAALMEEYGPPLLVRLISRAPGAPSQPSA